jgi:ribosome-associated translation inhibitor RaiA
LITTPALHFRIRKEKKEKIMDKPEFPIEYNTDVPVFAKELQDEVEERLLSLAGDHTDLTGASIAVSQPAQRDVPFVYEARILVSMRREDVVGRETSDTLQGALKGALNAVERQVRERRKKFKETWKRTDIPGTPASFPDDTPEQ